MDDPDLHSATVKVFAGQIAKAQVRSEELEKEKINLSATYDTLIANADVLYTPQTLVALIRSSSPKNNDLRLRLRSEIRRRVSRIELVFGATVQPSSPVVREEEDGTFAIEFDSVINSLKPESSQILAKVYFVNGSQRWIVFQKDEAVLLFLK
jgi:hypothetical protein